MSISSSTYACLAGWRAILTGCDMSRRLNVEYAIEKI
jgi:hypothetical protein